MYNYSDYFKIIQDMNQNYEQCSNFKLNDYIHILDELKLKKLLTFEFKNMQVISIAYDDTLARALDLIIKEVMLLEEILRLADDKTLHLLKINEEQMQVLSYYFTKEIIQVDNYYQFIENVNLTHLKAQYKLLDYQALPKV